jgi:hypothetical protein
MNLCGNVGNNTDGITARLVKTIRWPPIGVLCCVMSCSMCLAHTPLDPSQVIEFKISKSGLTRITIDNDSIEDVYAYPAEPDLITHHKSGHVFVTPDELEIPVYLTVITRRGVAQDLRLIPTAKKAEPILLRYEEKPMPPIFLSSLSPQDASAHLLAQFIKGKVPAGFNLATATNSVIEEVSRGEGPIEAILDMAYQNDQFRVLVFSIKNESSERCILDNKVFWGEGGFSFSF